MEQNIMIRENTKSWTVRKAMDKVKVTYSIPKDICPDRKSLEDYLKKERMV